MLICKPFNFKMFRCIVLLFLVTIFGASSAHAKSIDVFARTYIITASNLPNSDKDGQILISDPFLVIRDSGGVQIFRSPTQDNTLNPVFLVTFDWRENEVYTFEVRDEDNFNPDDTLGQIAVPAFRLVGTHLLANPSGGQIQIKQIHSKL